MMEVHLMIDFGRGTETAAITTAASSIAVDLPCWAVFSASEAGVRRVLRDGQPAQAEM